MARFTGGWQSSRGLHRDVMKIFFALLAFVIVTLQYRLWLGEDSIRALNLLEVDLEAQRQGNAELTERNRLVEIEVLDLKNGLEAVEERARSELGMIRDGEVFYLIVD